MKIEKMDDFFTKRIDDYENRMLNHVEDCREGYEKEEESLFAEAKRIREEENISSEALMHCDTPCCPETQL